MTDHHAILSEFGTHLPEKDKEFARSIWRATRNGGGSEKQRYWLAQLAERAQTAASVSSVESVPGQFADLAQRMVAAAAARVEDGKRHGKVVVKGVKFFVAGERSKYAGHVMVTSDDRENYYGRIDPAGTFYGSAICTDDVFDTIRHLNADPESAAKQHAEAEHSCCFCQRALTDPRSTSAGYGPICAGYYGLPWGEPAELETTE